MLIVSITLSLPSNTPVGKCLAVKEIVDMSDKTEEVIPGFSVGVDYVEVVHCSYVVVYMRMIINGVFCVGSVNVGNNVRMC